MTMYYEIDIEALHKDLMKYYEDLAYCGMPAYLVDVTRAELATPQELVRMAEVEHIDIVKYIIRG